MKSTCADSADGSCRRQNQPIFWSQYVDDSRWGRHTAFGELRTSNPELRTADRGDQEPGHRLQVHTPVIDSSTAAAPRSALRDARFAAAQRVRLRNVTPAPSVSIPPSPPNALRTDRAGAGGVFLWSRASRHAGLPLGEPRSSAWLPRWRGTCRHGGLLASIRWSRCEVSSGLVALVSTAV